jgi:hypothetical protein
MLTNFQEHYWVIEKSATPTALLLPWFPSPAQRAKKASTKVLFGTLQHYIEKRKKAPVPSSDAIDILLAEGSNYPVCVWNYLRRSYQHQHEQYVSCLRIHRPKLNALFQPLGCSCTFLSIPTGKPPSVRRSTPSLPNTPIHPSRSTNGSPPFPSPYGRMRRQSSTLSSVRPSASLSTAPACVAIFPVREVGEQ